MPLQVAALNALDARPGPGVVRALADSWKALTPALRARAVEVATGRKERLAPFLEARLAGEVSAEAIDGAHRAAPLASPEKSVAEAARAAFGAAGPALDPKKFDAGRAAPASPT